MTFPILKYMALKTEPVTAYELEKTKLDIMRDGKTKKGWIDKPTIYASLKFMEGKEIWVTEERKCKGGRVRRKYVVSVRGILALLRAVPHNMYDPKLIGVSMRYVRDLAGNWRNWKWPAILESYNPLIFTLWSSFIDAKVEDLAVWRLLYTSRHAGDYLDMEEEFFEPEIHYVPSDILQLDRWNEAVRTNEKIKQATRDHFLEKVDQHANLTGIYVRHLSAPDLALMGELGVRQKLEEIIQKLREPPKKVISAGGEPAESISPHDVPEKI
jgi:DNA-binding PadR family transcriptional regulator